MSAGRRAPRVAAPKTNLQRAAEALTGRPSLIATLHARYEKAWAGYNLAEAAQPAEPVVAGGAAWSSKFACETAMREISDEIDLICRLILWQAPTSYEDLTILSFHAFILGGHVDRDDDKEAIEQGLKSVFSYLEAEGHVGSVAGHQFQTAAALAFRQVRARRGIVEAGQ